MNVGTVVRDIVIRNRAEGAQETTAALKGVGQAYELVARVTETTSKNQLSMEQSFDRLERRLSATARAQFEYEKAQRQVNNAVAQNPALQERANAVLAELERRYQQVAQAADRAAAAQKQAAQTAVNRQTIMPDRASDIAAYGVELDRLRSKYNPLWAAGQQYKQTLTEINMAARVGAITDRERAAAIQLTKDAFTQQVAVLRGVATGHAVAGQSISVHANILNAAQSAAAVYAGRLGSLGFALTSLGPAGIAAGAALGAAAIGGALLVKMVNDLADKSGKLVDFAETTGLTTTQLQTLNKAGAEVGLSSEKIGRGFEYFTAQLNEAREGSGKLYETMRGIDAGLANQLAEARSAAEAWDVYAKAINRADINQRNALSRAGFGKGVGAGMSRLGNLSAQAGGIGGLEQPRFAPTPEELRRWDDLKDKVDYLRGHAGTLFAAMFADPILQAQLKFYEGLVAILQKTREIAAERERGIAAAQRQFPDAFTDPEQMTKQRRQLLRSRGQLEAPQAEIASPIDLSEAFAAEQINATTQAIKARTDALIRDINAMKEMHGVMGAAVTPTEQFRLKVLELDLALAKQVITQEQYTQSVAALQSQMNAPITTLQNQLALAQAVTAQERMAVQQRITYNQVLEETKSPEQASLRSMLERKVAQAQINAGAKEQLASLQDQHAVASARTGAERIAAQEAATYASLLRQGVALSLAMQIAAQERANAEAQASASVLQQADALNDQTAMIYAALRGTEAKVAAEQAYNNAIKSGADTGAARELQEATLANFAAKRRAQEAKIADEIERQVAACEELIRAIRAGWLAGDTRSIPGNWLSGPSATMIGTKGQFDVGPSPQGKLDALLEQQFGKGGATGTLTGGGFGRRGFTEPLLGPVQVSEQGLRFRADEILMKGGGLEGAIAEVRKFFKDQPNETLSVLQDLFNRVADEDPIRGAALMEAEIARLRTEPRSLARDDTIKSLTEALESLRESTDALNSTIGLDPLYTQGHGYVGIGYNQHGGTSPRIPIDPNTQPFVPALTQPTGAPMIQNAPVGGSITSPGTTMIDPRTGRPIFGAAAGGMFMVGGSGGVDSKYVPLALTPGELIEVTPERETHHLGGKQQTVINNVSNNNTFNFPPSRDYGDRRTKRHMFEGFGRAMAQAH